MFSPLITTLTGPMAYTICNVMRHACMLFPFLRAASIVASLCNASYWHVLPLNVYLIQFVNWKKYFLFACIRHVFLHLRVIVPKSPSQLLCFLETSKRRLRRGVPNLNVAKEFFKNHAFKSQFFFT